MATPGIIQEFDPATQTVTVQTAIREKIIDEQLVTHWFEIPLLLDVPIVIPRAGGFALTLPIVPGDECLVVFADRCIDAWFSSGGVQNQIESRRHELSDGFAIIGVWSQPRVLAGYASDAAQLRSDDGSVAITLGAGSIDIDAPIVRINGTPITP
ncbi:Gp138 family membrane-puncturing spike protein [Paenibacillus agricola]|uniref:Gp138 family membrane-puncturing spike protein n=1 Tax=Paenibacillus agricola TaxID=2716264 RepID=UPI001A9FA15C|nr:Gp138 family membrane-puncturing spike protein [Paenibacillus agricola]